MNKQAGPWDSRETCDYIGDGVYAAYDGYRILLRIDYHRNEESEICLEPEVLRALNEFAVRMEVRRAQEAGLEVSDDT